MAGLATPDGKATPAFLQAIGSASRRLDSKESRSRYIEMVFDMKDKITKDK